MAQTWRQNKADPVSFQHSVHTILIVSRQVAGKNEITTEITMGITEITIVGSSRGRYDMVG